MKNAIFVFTSALILTLTMPLSAVAKLEIPPPLRQAQELMVSQGICETRWEQLATDIPLQFHELERGSKLWLIPCALWAYNLAWSVYVTIPESTHPDGFITKPMMFVTHSAHEGGLVATNVLHNVVWIQDKKSLASRFFLNGFEHCGVQALYQWRAPQQSFRIQILMKQDDCRKPSAPWESAFTSPPVRGQPGDP